MTKTLKKQNGNKNLLKIRKIKREPIRPTQHASDAGNGEIRSRAR
jgi:hypothetical protein